MTIYAVIVSTVLRSPSLVLPQCVVLDGLGKNQQHWTKLGLS
jgi:hypothetical protein